MKIVSGPAQLCEANFAGYLILRRLHTAENPFADSFSPEIYNVVEVRKLAMEILGSEFEEDDQPEDESINFVDFLNSRIMEVPSTQEFTNTPSEKAKSDRSQLQLVRAEYSKNPIITISQGNE